ncbi:hypothetical protein PS870_06434 [Pseudomonas fluorescens]|uniref:Uncharacterized protein n=1 Tax=Pseudomonas fluorescens TaxID=294 RepID=A0A5E7QHM7_PSEFL|nr:hypothetical protein [Pseudomonas fluorescens]VVP61752.1 hypothetical protein PS870_06434 [Pseudomonas fluorescens]
MDNFIIKVTESELDESFRTLIEGMQSLKDLPGFPFDAFYNLVIGCLDDLSISVDSPTLSAGVFRADIRPGPRLELVTAALLALRGYLHR